MKKLTAFNVAELVDLTSSKVFTSEEKQIKPDLSFETAKLAILELFDRIDNKFPFEFNEEAFEIDDVAINLEEAKITITWRLKGGTIPVGNKLSIREYIEYTAKATDTNETLEVIKSLVDEFDNYIPLFAIRNQLKHLSRSEQDEAINSLTRKDIIELSKTNEPWLYSEEQRSAGIPTPISGDLFFAILN